MSYASELAARYRRIRLRLRPPVPITNIGALPSPDIEIPDPAPFPELPPMRAGRAPVRAIVRCVSDEFRVSRIDLVSARRTRSIIRPRQLVMYLARHLTTLSLAQIGAQLGNRDHTTILHGVRAIDRVLGPDRPQVDPDAMLRDVVREFRAALQARGVYPQ